MKQKFGSLLYKCTLSLMAAGCFLLLGGTGKAQSPSFPVPATLQQQLSACRQHNDLSNWIYTQVQWVSAMPAGRAPLLEQAVSTAWRAPLSNEEVQAWLDLLLNEGHALLLNGDIVHSTDAYRAALQWVKQHSDIVDDGQVLEYLLKPLGNNYTRLGDYEQALYIQQRALDIALSLHDKSAVAGMYANLATTAGAMEKPQIALQYCREGLKVAGKGDAARGLLLCEQANAYAQLDLPTDAQQSYSEGIRLLEQKSAGSTTAAYWLLSAYQQVANIGLGDFQKEISLYNKALLLQSKLLQQNGAIRRRERAKLYERLGYLQTLQKQNGEAHHWLQECLSLLVPGKTFATLTEKDVYGENTLADALFDEAITCRQEHNMDDAIRLFRLSFMAESKLRNEYITAGSREWSVANSRRRLGIALDAAYMAWQQSRTPASAKQVLEFMETGKSRLLLEELQQQHYRESQAGNDSLGRRIQFLEKALAYYQRDLLENEPGDSLQHEIRVQQKKIEWELADTRKRARPGQAAVQERQASASSPGFVLPALQPQQAIRSFFMANGALYTIEMDASGIKFVDKQFLTSATFNSIREFIDKYFQHGPGAMLNNPGMYYREAYTIYGLLFGSHPLAPGKEYIFLTDALLSLLPMEALVTSPECPASVEQWPFLIKQSAISYGWSLQTLQAQSAAPVTGKGFSGFFIAQNSRGQQMPAAILQEKEGIGQTIKTGDWQLNEQATVSAFRAALEKDAIVHISTHAFAGSDSAAVPHILLYDAPFYLFELKGMAHHPAVVVLSACRTGDGRMVTGEGVQSLARAFTACGTNGVVAGWWNVHDEVAARLMRQFYISWAAGGNAANALRQSKLDLLNDAQVPYMNKLPYYWAALNYQGNPIPLQGNEWIGGGRIRRWVIVLALLLVLVLFFNYFFFRRTRQ